VVIKAEKIFASIMDKRIIVDGYHSNALEIMLPLSSTYLILNANTHTTLLRGGYMMKF